MVHAWIIVLAVVATAIVGCSKEPPASPAAGAPTTLRVQLNWVPEPEFGGIYEAERAGLFEKHGLDVQILQGGPDVPAVQMVASRKVEFGVAAADEVLTLREKGGDLVGLFATYQTSPQGIMAHASSGVNGLEDVWKRNHVLAVQPGLAYVKHFRVKWGDPTAQLVPYPSGIGQFLADKTMAQQCFVTAEPIAAKRGGADVKVFLIADSGFNPYTAVIVASGKTLAFMPDAAAKFIAAIQEGWRLYLDNPSPANLIMAKLNPSMDAATMDEAAEVQKPLIETEYTREHGLGAMSHERWQELSQQLVSLSILEKPAAVDACFRNPGAPQVGP